MWLGCLTTRFPSLCCLAGCPNLAHKEAQGGDGDVIRRDLKDVKIGEDEWCEKAASREGWRAMCRLGLEELQSRRGAEVSTTREVLCEVCGRKFRQESDKKRHKCAAERKKPVSQQRGAVQCGTCHRWFKRRGGMAVHVCRQPGS